MKLFAISKTNTHKIITIFGLKFSFLCKELVLENKINLLNYKLCKYMPEEKYPECLKDWFYEQTGKILDLENPKTFNEKIQWLKLYDKNPLKTQLADKYLVRDWVKERIGEEYLIPLLGVWDRFEDIDFDKLPEKFVMKCNHGCKYNIIVKDKSKLNLGKTKGTINKWMNEDFAFKFGLQPHYSAISRKIIAEKYIENSSGELSDYKFYCFDGKVHFIQYISERSQGYRMVFFDREWNPQDFVSNSSMLDKLPQKPTNLDEIIKKAEILSQGFNFVRVDFYILENGDVKFGEMTFTPGSGVLRWQPEAANLMMGNLLTIDRK